MKIPQLTPLGLLAAAVLARLEVASQLLFADTDSVNLWLTMLWTAVGSIAACGGLGLTLWVMHKRRLAQSLKDAKEEGKEEERERNERKDEAEVIAAVQEGQKKIERMFEDHRAVDHAAIWKRVDELNTQAKEDRHAAGNRLAEVLGPIQEQLVEIADAMVTKEEFAKHASEDRDNFNKIFAAKGLPLMPDTVQGK